MDNGGLWVTLFLIVFIAVLVALTIRFWWVQGPKKLSVNAAIYFIGVALVSTAILASGHWVVASGFLFGNVFLVNWERM